jgi:hypothetical protein
MLDRIKLKEENPEVYKLLIAFEEAKLDGDWLKAAVSLTKLRQMGYDLAFDLGSENKGTISTSIEQ